MPDLYRLIVSPRGYILAIRRPRDGRNDVGMAVISQDVMAAVRIPYLHRTIGTGRGNACQAPGGAIGRPGQGFYPLTMATIGADGAGIEGIPDQHVCIPARRIDVLAIRQPPHTMLSLYT